MNLGKDCSKQTCLMITKRKHKLCPQSVFHLPDMGVLTCCSRVMANNEGLCTGLQLALRNDSHLPVVFES